MRLGLIARRDWTGLGVQTHSYYKHLNPSKTLVIDLSPLNGNKQNVNWYPNEQVVLGIPNKNDIAEFLQGLDVVITAETPYNFDLYRLAKKRGIKTICVENPEFYDHVKYPELPLPDVIILPSVWLEDEIRSHAESKGVKVYQIHHPVDRQETPFTLRDQANFIHIAGKPAAHDRNGTWDYLAAMPDGRVTVQDETFARQIRKRYRHSKVYDDVTDQKMLYQMGNILVFPRKYGGNCLPLNEALSSGMPVIMPDISPNNNLLPKEWLVTARKTSEFHPRGKVDIYSVDRVDLLRVIEWFKSADMKEQSMIADITADSISWETLLPKYLEVIQE